MSECNEIFNRPKRDGEEEYPAGIVLTDSVLQGTNSARKDAIGDLAPGGFAQVAVVLGKSLVCDLLGQNSSHTGNQS